MLLSPLTYFVLCSTEITKCLLCRSKHVKAKKVCIAVNGNPSQSYGASPAVWDHTLLPVTRHRWMRPILTPAKQAGTQFTYLPQRDGRLSWPWCYTPIWFTCLQSHPSWWQPDVNFIFRPRGRINKQIWRYIFSIRHETENCIHTTFCLCGWKQVHP